MPSFKTLNDIDARGKRVFLRLDLNVPMRDGVIGDLTRIERAAPTIKELLDAGGRVILASHFGRPKGKIDPSMSLEPLCAPLSKALSGAQVRFAGDCIGDEARAAVDQLANGQVLLLENLRFHSGEETNDEGFITALAELADLYVNDAFSTAHRAHASTEGIAHRLPAYAGRLMQAELQALTQALEAPERPVAAVVGGAKVSSKLDLLGNLVGRVDKLIIGGGMANTFLFAEGKEVGISLAERELADTAREIRAKAEAAGCEIILQTDAVVAAEFKEGAAAATVSVDQVPSDKMILDVGPATVANLLESLADCRTLVWNGPLGAFEVPPFDAGTVGLARGVARMSEAGQLRSVAGGGDTVAALAHAGVVDRFTYVSTAGGAFLEWLEGKTLPGVAALMAD
jgi:phosphoglycerate kinase